jgi:hypothetical protein
MLNFFLNKPKISAALLNKTAIAFIFIALLNALVACGKRTPPLPPIERVPQRVEIVGFQRGNQVRISWTMPERNAPDGSVLNISRVDVYRLAEPLTANASLTEEEFAARSTVIASVPVADADFARKTLNYFDPLELAGQNIKLRYAIRFVNAAGQKAAFSNFLLIEPAAKIANPPVVLPPRLSPEAILVSWRAPDANIDGSKPPNILGYNIYRARNDETPARLVNQNPVTANELRDQNFEFGESYKYFVRTVSLGTNAEPVESLESAVVEIKPKDIFPPKPPEGITLAASPNTISIFFAANLENDVVGYRLFRSTDRTNWTPLNERLLETNTYQDTQVQSGRTYFYYLIAVDKFGNESEKSEVVSETVP